MASERGDHNLTVDMPAWLARDPEIVSPHEPEVLTVWTYDLRQPWELQIDLRNPRRHVIAGPWPVGRVLLERALELPACEAVGEDIVRLANDVPCDPPGSYLRLELDAGVGPRTLWIARMALEGVLRQTYDEVPMGEEWQRIDYDAVIAGLLNREEH